MKYCDARATRELQELSFRVYVTDALHLQGEGKYLTQRWFDTISADERSEKVDDRPVMEIVSDIWTRAGLKKGGG